MSTGNDPAKTGIGKMSGMKAELIAPCGMNCRICIAYAGYRKDREKRAKPCQGCRPSGKKCAFIRKRCPKLMKKEIDFCFECNRMPCRSLRSLDKRYRTRYGMSMVGNLLLIKKNGIGKFLKAQEEKYKCRECGSIICVHDGRCHGCGKAESQKG